MMQKPLGTSSFSRPFLVSEWRDDEASVVISAEEDERAALAAAFGLPAIAALKAEFMLERASGSRVRVHGRLDAIVTRTCVVSLDPFETEVSEPIDVVFAPENEAGAAKARFAAEQEVREPALVQEPPDPIVDGRIDLGALAAEFLALGLDPYPRKPGIDFAASVDASAPASPFALLGRLKEQGRQ